MSDAWTEAMLDGAFEQAWAISDAVMLQRRGQSCADLPYHLRWVWDGTPLTGRDVLVRCYHGLGDTLQFMRFVPQLLAVAQSVAVEAQPELLRVLRGIGNISAFHPLGAAPVAIDVAVESMELPHALRLRLEDLPGPVPYLRLPNAGRAGGERHRAGAPRLRVGIVWAAGNWRRARSVPSQALRPLLDLPVDLVCLQLGAARRDPESVPLMRAFTAAVRENATITETAALICDLDLVVTVDTMVAHLAGALGRPVWTLLDADADWRWMRGRNDSPWYPTMRLFRQRRPGDWKPAVDELAAELARNAGAPDGTALTAASLRETMAFSHRYGVDDAGA
jgi:Glycosyltransferase family 9 (heptosyltransferase)